MPKLLNLPQIFEASFGVLNAATAIVVLLLTQRIAPTLTLSIHRRAMQILVVIAGLIVLAESIGVLHPFLRPSTFAELLAISFGGFALYLMSRAERDEVASLRRSADVDDLTNLSSRSFFRRATRRIELFKNNDLPLSYAVLDVDDFKSYNDRYGHEAGDETSLCEARAARVGAGGRPHRPVRGE